MKRFQNKIIATLLALTCLNSAIAEGPTGPDVWERAAFGSLPGISLVNLFGNNGGITTTFEPFWPESATYTFLSANMSSPTISSANANDTSAGTGARTVTVTCVDSAYAVTTGTYTMNGQTGVNVTQSCMVVNSILVATAGSGNANAGIVYVGTGSITAGKPAVVHGLVAAGENVSNQFIYGVPAKKTLICDQWNTSSSSGTAGGHAAVIDYAPSASNLFLRRNLPGFSNTSQGFSSDFVLRFPEKTRLIAQVSATAGTGPAYAQANCLLIDSQSSNANQTEF